ncbi:hypothetical protein [Plantibacter sp. H53]|uniref:hypothetical protein n=1 Tax=Plantibacter sp. H53 TaxID=1827323 RepID=UPI000AE04E7C|nr:hypothetical protein [Plantibacter sp. H53]
MARVSELFTVLVIQEPQAPCSESDSLTDVRMIDEMAIVRSKSSSFGVARFELIDLG